MTASWHDVDQWRWLLKMGRMLLLILMQKAARMVSERKVLVSDM